MLRAYAPAIQTPQLFDIENVDIVRGPQGSGHFRNASAGAIRVQSRRPSGNYSANLRSTLGRYQADSGQGARHALIQDYEGALEFPIVEQATALNKAINSSVVRPLAFATSWKRRAANRANCGCRFLHLARCDPHNA